LKNRGEDPEPVVQRRLIAASREIAEYDKYDYVLVNDKLGESCEKLRAIVSSERLRREQRTLTEQERLTIELAESCRLANVRDRIQPILSSFSAPAPSARS
jgi:Guanylate kinase